MRETPVLWAVQSVVLIRSRKVLPNFALAIQLDIDRQNMRFLCRHEVHCRRKQGAPGRWPGC